MLPNFLPRPILWQRGGSHPGDGKTAIAGLDENPSVTCGVHDLGSGSSHVLSPNTQHIAGKAGLVRGIKLKWVRETRATL